MLQDKSYIQEQWNRWKGYKVWCLRKPFFTFFFLTKSLSSFNQVGVLFFFFFFSMPMSNYLSECLVCICAFCVFSFFFFFFFFFFNAYNRYCSCTLLHCAGDKVTALLMGPTITLFWKNKNKNRSHWTIHTFKNYFATVFLVFSFQQNKLYPNGP